MEAVNIHEAKTHLSRLVERAGKGEAFIIGKAGKPLVVVARLDAASAKLAKRLGFLDGKIRVPDDFDSTGRAEIERLFSGSAGNCCSILSS